MNKIKGTHTILGLALSAAGSALFLSLVAFAPGVSATEANLTRFGPATYELVQGKPTTYSATFRAIDGPAKLVLQDEGIDTAWIKINGRSVVEPKDFSGNGQVVVGLTINKSNTIEVTVPGRRSGTLGVRVTQVTQAELGLMRQGYFGLNTTNIERQRIFYNTLGLIGEIYPAGPETSTTFAQALGFVYEHGDKAQGDRYHQRQFGYGHTDALSW